MDTTMQTVTLRRRAPGLRSRRHAERSSSNSRKETPTMKGPTAYTLRRDGAVLGEYHDEGAALDALHARCPASWDHALRHEGYSITRPDGTQVEPYTRPARGA